MNPLLRHTQNSGLTGFPLPNR